MFLHSTPTAVEIKAGLAPGAQGHRLWSQATRIPLSSRVWHTEWVSDRQSPSDPFLRLVSPKLGCPPTGEPHLDLVHPHKSRYLLFTGGWDAALSIVPRSQLSEGQRSLKLPEQASNCPAQQGVSLWLLVFLGDLEQSLAWSGEPHPQHSPLGGGQVELSQEGDPFVLAQGAGNPTEPQLSQPGAEFLGLKSVGVMGRGVP